MRKFKGIEVDENEVSIIQKDSYFLIYDKNNNEIYFERCDGYWEKREFDGNHNVVYYEDQDDFYISYVYDKNNNQIYYGDSNGNWVKKEYDKNNNQIYFEDSKGAIRYYKGEHVG